VVHQILLALIAICGFAAAASAQTTVTLSTPEQINADLTIQGGNFGMVDFSGSDVLASKVSSESYTRRIMMKFDTQNFIPAGAVIQSAKLYLVLKHAESGENRPFTAYHVNRSFVKWETNWYYFRNGQRWSTPGGDLGQSFGTTYVGNAEGSAYAFDLTQMVQSAVNGNFGSRYTRLALIDTGGASGGNYKEFYSTRASNTSLRPKLVITYGGSSSGSSTPPPTESTAPSTGSGSSSGGGATLRVMQWNIKKTKGSDGQCNPDRIADVIAAQSPDVVSLNEVNFYSGTCAWSFDMADHLESLIQQRTGQQWYRQIVNVYGGTSGYGNVLLSRYAPTAQTSTLLSYSRGVAQISINVNGRTVDLFSTHVEYDNASWRPVQISQAVSWMSNFGQPRIMMGDFNTWPGTSDYNIIAQPYQDAWVAAQNAGTASAYNGTGATHGDSRFDYVFYTRNSILALQSVRVIDPRVGGVEASDHAPVVAVFKVN
jgi:endonuclease/exonuclease/phosphatase family metal-dependent hydrolase